MKEFSDWYRKTFPELSPARLIENDDLLGGNKKAVWFQSPHYRLGYIFDKATGEIKIRDFRAYFADLIEPYYQSPNSDINLSIYIPSIFDEINYGKDSWTLPINGKFPRTELTLKTILPKPYTFLSRKKLFSIC